MSTKRFLHLAVAALAVTAVMLLPGPMWAQYTDTTICSFCSLSGCTDGAALDTGALVFDSQGNPYGASHGGGNVDQGVVFKLSPPAGGSGSWTETVLYSFCSLSDYSDGAGPSAGVIFDSSGNLYGTTQDGGARQGSLTLCPELSEVRERPSQSPLPSFAVAFGNSG